MLLPSIFHQPTDRKAAQLRSEPLYYFDVVQAWLTKPLNASQVRKLRRLCPDLDDRDGSSEPMHLNPEWTYRLQARQPTRAFLLALQKIEATQRILINYVELARDECWPSRRVLDQVKAYRDDHELRLWHPKRQDTVAFDDSQGNTYDAARKKPRVLTRYMEEHCRITGECDCLHSEFRLMGVQSVSRASINSVRNILDFDHAAWWRTKTRMVGSVDVERLGRLVRNRHDNTRDRLPRVHVSRFGRHVYRFHADYRLGSALIAQFNTTQAFVDHFGGVSRLQQAGVFVSMGQANQSKCDVCT